MRCARKFANVFLRQTCANWAVAVFKVPLLYRDWPIVGDPCRMWIGCESSSTELLALCIWSILRSGTHYTAYSCSASCLRPSGNCRIATRCTQKRTAAVHTRRTVFKSLLSWRKTSKAVAAASRVRKKHCGIPQPARSQTHLSLLHSVSVCCTNAGCLPGLALGVALRSRSLRVKKVRALCAEPEEQFPKRL